MYTRNALYKHVDHVAVVVNNIERAADFYRDVFQLDLIMGLSYPPDGVHTNLVFSLGPENELELMGPLGDRGFIVDFLKKHGQGVHHLARMSSSLSTGRGRGSRGSPLQDCSTSQA